MTPKAPPKGKFQSTLPVRGATPHKLANAILAYISIHAPRAGSDLCRQSDCRASRSGFQSTLPVRGATPSGGFSISRERFQSTLPVRGATSA